MNADTITSFAQFVIPSGRAALVEMIQEFKKAYGENWLKKFKEENGEFSFLVDIVANYDARDAFAELKSYVSDLIDGDKSLETWQKIAARGAANLVLNGNYSNILDTHKALREEIDRPRF